MAEININAADNLISYINSNQDISIEDTKKALNIIKNQQNSNNPKYKELLLKIIELINKRTNEANEFVEVIKDNNIDKETKKILALENLPFKDGNIQVEKLIIEMIYDANEPYKTLEDMLIDLVYEYEDDPDELKCRIEAILTELGIESNIENKEEQKIEYLRFRI